MRLLSSNSLLHAAESSKRGRKEAVDPVLICVAGTSAEMPTYIEGAWKYSVGGTEAGQLHSDDYTAVRGSSTAALQDFDPCGSIGPCRSSMN